MTPINIIAKKKKIRRHENGSHTPKSFLETDKIMEISMQITCNIKKEP